MESENLLPHFKVFGIYCYPKSDRFQSLLPHPTSWRFVLILCYHLRLGLPSGLFPSGFSTKTLYEYTYTFPLYVLYAPSVSMFSIWSPDKYCASSSLCSFFQSPVTSSLLGPNILLSKHPQPNFLPRCFTQMQNNMQNYISVYLIVGLNLS